MLRQFPWGWRSPGPKRAKPVNCLRNLLSSTASGIRGRVDHEGRQSGRLRTYTYVFSSKNTCLSEYRSEKNAPM